mmetsp:Transcript_70923/g.203231  ORF Transcript_70923/g.203231 Transcript_70923/m.203231 type:complete len:206 (-) Transcript_70923:13-630(-)
MEGGLQSGGAVGTGRELCSPVRAGSWWPLHHHGPRTSRPHLSSSTELVGPIALRHHRAVREEASIPHVCSRLPLHVLPKLLGHGRPHGHRPSHVLLGPRMVQRAARLSQHGVHHHSWTTHRRAHAREVSLPHLPRMQRVAVHGVHGPRQRVARRRDPCLIDGTAIALEERPHPRFGAAPLLHGAKSGGGSDGAGKQRSPRRGCLA